MLKAMRRKLMTAHRPDLMAALDGELKRSFQAMRDERVIAHFSPSDDVEGTAWIPASIVARHRHASPGTPLDDVARGMITEQGAEPFRGDMRVLRSVTESVKSEGESRAYLVNIRYFTPIPTMGKRVALELTGSFLRPDDVPLDSPYGSQITMLLDACVSTLRWRAPKSGESHG